MLPFIRLLLVSSLAWKKEETSVWQLGKIQLCKRWHISQTVIALFRDVMCTLRFLSSWHYFVLVNYQNYSPWWILSNVLWRCQFSVIKYQEKESCDKTRQLQVSCLVTLTSWCLSVYVFSEKYQLMTIKICRLLSVRFSTWVLNCWLLTSWDWNVIRG